jgi:hypothetical protein
VACLDSSGNLLWNTFLGSGSNDEGNALVLDGSGHVYVTGFSNATWGLPVNAYSGGSDVFIACLDKSGTLLGNTFLGSLSHDEVNAIALDSSGNICIAGFSNATWGSPVNAYSGKSDAFVACLDSSGNLLWNTFLGSAGYDYGYDIAPDSSGNINVIGHSNNPWGSPVNPYSGKLDVFVACLDGSGNLCWNTFLGSDSKFDYGYGIALDSSGYVYVTGKSIEAWGSPINPHSGAGDVFGACLDGSGNLRWNTFLGSANDDLGFDIVLDSSENIYVTGASLATWGIPLQPYAGYFDAFIVSINQQPIPEIKANGSDGPIIISRSDTLKIKISLITNGLNDEVDIWLAYHNASGWYHYNRITKSWDPGPDVTYQGTLFELNSATVFEGSGLSPDIYKFYFGVDLNMDGNLTKSELYYDQVKVTVTQ